MKSNGFEVWIDQGKEVGQYVELKHGQEYAINLCNRHSTRCDAYIEIDGQHVGTFRVNRYGTASVQRPANIERAFTFYRLDSAEGGKAGLSSVDDSKLGLISVTFKPERKVERESYDVLGTRGGGVSRGGFAPQTKGITRSAAGGTGLGAENNQRYNTVSELDYDASAFYSIHLRLRESIEPDILPLSAVKGTPVPPPVS